MVDKGSWQQIAVLATAVIGNLGWLWYSANSLSADERPFIHVYILSVFAFLVWAPAIDTTVATKLAGMSEKDNTPKVLFLIGVFLIPLADGILTQFRNRHLKV